LRLTGKAGRWAVGAIGIDDRAPEQVPGTDRAGVGVVRVQREIADESTDGALVSERAVGDGSNRVASADTRLKLSKTWVLTGQVGPTFQASLDWDRDGVLLDRSLQASWEVKLVGETKLEAQYESAFELFRDLPFDMHATNLTFESAWLKWLALTASYKQGTDVNHKPPSGTAPFLAGAAKGELTYTFRPTPRLRLDHTWLYSRLTTRPG